MANRKLGRPTDQRMAMLRNQVTNLIWYGKIETTLARGKEVQSLAEHLVTIAMRECDNTIEVTKKHMNDKKQVEELTVQNDSPARLAARRQIMRYLYDIPAVQNEGQEAAEGRQASGRREAVPRDRAQVQEARRGKGPGWRLHPHCQEGPPSRRRRRDGNPGVHLIKATQMQAAPSPQTGEGAA